MASRVNKRFVIILVVGVVGLLGLLVAAYSVAYKSAGDLAKRGDDFMAKGEYKLAEISYSKAVNKDSTNTENLAKWIDSLERVIPETETEYRDRYNGDYTGAIRKTATILRNNVDAHERFLSIRYEMLESSYSRGLADVLIEDTSSSLAFFNEDPAQVQLWERLKRYRGLALAAIARRQGVLDENQFALGIDDLERALVADPDDVETAIGLMDIKTSEVSFSRPESDIQARIDTRIANITAGNAFIAAHQNNIRMKMHILLLNIDMSLKNLGQIEDSSERLTAITEVFDSYKVDLQKIVDSLETDSRDQLSVNVINNFLRLEVFINSEAKLAQSRHLIDLMIEDNGDNAALLALAGRVAKEAGDLDEAIGWYSRIEDLETKPLSFEGLNQYYIQRRTLFDQATIRVEQASSLEAVASEEEINAAVAKASEMRDRYASSVTEDDLNLMMLDGKLARMNSNYEEALRLFKKFNEQNQQLNPDGLWEEGVTALRIDQFGVARKALQDMIPLDTNTQRKQLARQALAKIEIKLKNYEAAAQLYKDILSIDPSWQEAVDQLEAVNTLLNPQLHEDPIVAAVLTARQIRLGSSESPGDFAGAIEYLREAVETFNNEPQIAFELTSLMLDSEDIEGARNVTNKALQVHPDSESLLKLQSVLQNDDLIDIRVQIQRQSERPEFDKLISIAQLAADGNRKELLLQTIEDLNTINPDDPRVVDVSFLGALKYGNIEEARSIANRPKNSQIERLTYQARIEISEQNPTKAIELLKQAAASGTADASVFQLLAIMHRDLGQIDESLQSFERALSIRPDNTSTITEYLWTLAVTARRYDEALSVARRLQLHGATNPTFMNLWLNLEALSGGKEGRDFAIRQRERLLELNPTNIENKAQLTRMYIQNKQWDSAMELILQLRASDDQLAFAQLEAQWYADQGTYENQSGLVLANGVFSKYIDSLPQPVSPEPFIANAEFMLSRGRPDLAISAANEAVERQSTETMEGSKLLGNLYMRINNSSDAIEAYNAVIENDADPDFSYHNRLIEAYVRLDRFSEADALFTKLPSSHTTKKLVMFQAADIARGLGDIPKSRSILDDAVARYPNDSSVYTKRAEFMIGDETLINDLLSDIGRAIDLDANSSQAYRVRAAGFFSAGRRDDAIKDLRSAIRLNPNLDRSIYALLNELLSMPGRSGEALDIAREVTSRREDDANLMSRIGGLFKSRAEWEKAAEMFGLAWDKRHSIPDGADYIDALVRMTPPDSKTANDVINQLGQMVGNINDNAGLLAAQALVLQARGRDDFAQQQITKAFDISVNNNQELVNWSGNLTRYFEGEPPSKEIEFLEALKRRNTTPIIQNWLDLFIARRLVKESDIDQRAFEILNRLIQYKESPEIQTRAYRIKGSTYFAQKNYEAATAVWAEALEVFPDDWEMNNNLAFTLSDELNRSEEALVYAQKAIDQNIARSEAYETMAGVYRELGRYDEAEEMINIGSNYIQSIPARVTMILSTAKLALARNDLVDAKSRLNDAESAVRSAPTSYPNLEEDIAELAQEINSAGG